MSTTRFTNGPGFINQPLPNLPTRLYFNQALPNLPTRLYQPSFPNHRLFPNQPLPTSPCRFSHERGPVPVPTSMADPICPSQPCNTVATEAATTMALGIGHRHCYQLLALPLLLRLLLLLATSTKNIATITSTGSGLCPTSESGMFNPVLEFGTVRTCGLGGSLGVPHLLLLPYSESLAQYIRCCPQLFGMLISGTMISGGYHLAQLSRIHVKHSRALKSSITYSASGVCHISFSIPNSMQKGG